MERKKITFDSFIRGSIGCVLVVGILMLVERLSGVLLPFFIAWLIAYMVYPLVKFFQYKLRLKSRIISIFCSLFLITVIGVTMEPETMCLRTFLNLSTRTLIFRR